MSPAQEAGEVHIVGTVHWWECGYFYVGGHGWSGVRARNHVAEMEQWMCSRRRWHRGEHRRWCG